MKKRKLNNTDLEIAPLIFGGNVFGWTVDEQTAFTLLDAFVNAGFNCIDTANIYSTWVPGNQGGESETIIGRWMKKRGNRSDIVLCSKVGMEMEGKKGLSTAYILEAIEGSLKRLQTDYIDIYFSHKDDLTTPIEETLLAYSKLVEQGKVRVIGASNFNAERLEESLNISHQKGYPSYQILQPLYNLYDRFDYEKNLEPICIKHGLDVVPYWPLASGFLTGKYHSEKDLSKSPRGKWLGKYLDSRGENLLKALHEVALKYESNPTQVALAWILARSSVTAPIVSARNLEQLQILMGIFDVKLQNSDMTLLNQVC
jgi:aryl-alcohol dehydrogenase-like predicted oxidoreductase